MALGPLMLDVPGTALSPADRSLLASPAVGGVILFKRNFENESQLTDLNNEIKAIRQPSLLIAVDQEGGRVQRFDAPFTRLPPLGWFGLLHDQRPDDALQLARDTGWLMAAELLASGVDLSFTPVLDLAHGVSAVIGDRALHRKPAVVVALARQLMAGMRSAGMAAVGKHFPGHGAVVADSHHELPVDRREYSDMIDDIAVFGRMIEAGLPAIMTAHVVYAALDSLPASLSPWWIGTELRSRLGFRGAVFTDDLSMHATLGFGDIESRVEAAMAAGSDMVLVCNDRPAAERAAHYLEQRPQPASMARLARLRAQPEWQGQDLRASERWHTARQSLDVALGRESAASGA